MIRTLSWKESRELLPLVALTLAVQAAVFFLPSGLPFLGQSYGTAEEGIVPFVERGPIDWMLMLGGIAASAIGLWQTLWESGRGTFLFLLHRPAPRSALFRVKLAVGLIATLLVAGLPLAIYTLWAATPGTHASPFYWSMTVWAWLVWIRLPVIYLGAFLSGLRPGRWFGSRAFPLFAALAAIFLIAALEQFPLIAVAATLTVEACFLAIIYYVAASRDYS